MNRAPVIDHEENYPQASIKPEEATAFIAELADFRAEVRQLQADVEKLLTILILMISGLLERYKDKRCHLDFTK